VVTWWCFCDAASQIMKVDRLQLWQRSAASKHQRSAEKFVLSSLMAMCFSEKFEPRRSHESSFTRNFLV